MIELILPWPPSVNHYFGYGRGNVYIKASGKEYRKAVKDQIEQQLSTVETITDLIKLEIEAWMPDNRKRDLDNTMKALLDAITHAGLWADDSLIDDLRVYRARENGKLLIGGMLKVKIQIPSV
jgi:crossover junction endodeoxyribonuclease RusA